MGSPGSIMRAFVLFAVVALAAGAPRKPSPPLFQEVVAGLLEELRLLLVSSLIRLLSLEVESVAPSCAEDPWLPPIWLSQPVTAVMDNLPAVLESVLETTTSM